MAAMAAAPRPRTLDVAEQQILIDFYDDEDGYFWRQRLLLLKLDGPGKWIAASPDHEVESVDISTHRVIPLRRHAQFPDRIRGQVYAFDPITDDELRTLNMEARALALVLAPGGVAGATSGDSCWLVADTALEEFGDEVPDSVLSDPGRLRSEGAVGIAQLDDDWVLVEKVMRSDIGIWKDGKRVGPGRDARLSTTTRDARQRRYQDLAAAITDLKEVPIDDWVFRGLRAIVEVLDAIRASGQGVLGYQEFWIKSSGVTPDHSVVHHHRDVLGIFFFALQVDQLNVYNCTSMELAARQLLRAQKAVKRNPKNPDFCGLSMMTMRRLDNIGGVANGDYARWLAEEQKSEAFTLKQQRLHRKEVFHDEPAASGDGSGNNGGGGGRRCGGGGGGQKAADAK